MKVVISAKLKLRHTPEQKMALEAVTLAYRDALNFASQAAFGLNKTSSAPKIHGAVYPSLRDPSGPFGLGSQLACTVSKQVSASYRALWTKVKDHSAALKKGHTKRRYDGLDAPPQFVSRTLEYQHGRDYSFKPSQQVSIVTLDGRIVLAFDGSQKHLDLSAGGVKTGAAKLYDQRSKKQYHLIVALSLELPDPQPTDYPNIVGVDVGQRYHLVATDRTGQSMFQKGAQACSAGWAGKTVRR